MSLSHPSPPGPLGATDPLRWRLDSSNSGHYWHYQRDVDSTAYERLWGDDPANVRESLEQTPEAKHALGLPLPVISGLSDPQGDPWESAKKGELTGAPEAGERFAGC